MSICTMFSTFYKYLAYTACCCRRTMYLSRILCSACSIQCANCTYCTHKYTMPNDTMLWHKHLTRNNRLQRVTRTHLSKCLLCMNFGTMPCLMVGIALCSITSSNSEHRSRSTDAQPSLPPAPAASLSAGRFCKELPLRGESLWSTVANGCSDGCSVSGDLTAALSGVCWGDITVSCAAVAAVADCFGVTAITVIVVAVVAAATASSALSRTLLLLRGLSRAPDPLLEPPLDDAPLSRRDCVCAITVKSETAQKRP
jgi:hypothetical protein